MPRISRCRELIPVLIGLALSAIGAEHDEPVSALEPANKRPLAISPSPYSPYSPAPGAVPYAFAAQPRSPYEKIEVSKDGKFITFSTLSYRATMQLKGENGEIGSVSIQFNGVGGQGSANIVFNQADRDRFTRALWNRAAVNDELGQKLAVILTQLPLPKPNGTPLSNE